MDWKFRTFCELSGEEVYKLIQLRIEVFSVEQNSIYQDCDDKDLMAYHLFLEDKGEIVACLRILKKGVSYNEVAIGRIVVKKNYRGKGIGHKMIGQAIEFIERTMNEYDIRISAQAHLEKFYGDFGFKRVSNVYLEDNIPHIQMLYSNLNKSCAATR